MEGVGIESRFWKSIFVPIDTDPDAHLAFCTEGAGSFLGISVRSVVLTTRLLVAERLRGAAPPPPLCVCTGMT